MLKAIRKRSEPQRRSQQTTNSTPPDQGNALFEAFVCEFHWTVLQIGAIGSCMNAAAAQNRAWMLRSCSNLLPVESPVIKATLEAWQEIGLPRKLATSLQKIYVDLADANRKTRPISEAAGAFTGPQISLAKLEQMAALWRKISEECESAVQALEPESRWRLSGIYTGNSLVLGRFLKGVISGAHDCVSHLGEVAVPVLPQRRKTRSYALLQPCVIRRKEGTSMAFGRAISKNGIDVTCESAVDLKERVTVELRNGRKMRGIVVWSRDKNANIQFDEQLDTSDPLFTRRDR